MTMTQADEIRVRVTIDREIPDLFARLGSSKRQAREVVHLLRLGLQMEQMLSGKTPWFMPSPMMGALAGVPAVSMGVEAAEASVTSAKVEAEESSSILDFAQDVGLTADYFAGAPIAYAD